MRSSPRRLLRRFLPRRRDELPAGWEAIVAARISHWALLDETERAALTDAIRALLAKRWEAARGFALDDEIRLTIAAQAALLVIGLDDDVYRDVTSIIVHPSTMLTTGPRPVTAPGLLGRTGLFSDEHEPVIGVAHARRGPVLISWDAAREGARHPERGHNVVFHEFAHKLDLLDDVVDGTPPIHDPAARRRWFDVCTRELAALRAGAPSLLRGYAAENPGEFFAVATEAFFDVPIALRARHTELYEALRDFYRQDPAARAEKGAGPDAHGGGVTRQDPQGAAPQRSPDRATRQRVDDTTQVGPAL